MATESPSWTLPNSVACHPVARMSDKNKVWLSDKSEGILIKFKSPTGPDIVVHSDKGKHDETQSNVRTHLQH